MTNGLADYATGFKESRADLRHYVNDSNMPNMTHGPENFEDPLDIPTFQRLNPIKKK